MFKRNPLPRPSVPQPILPQFSLRRRCGAQTARAAAVVVAAVAVAAAARLLQARSRRRVAQTAAAVPGLPGYGVGCLYFSDFSITEYDCGGQ